MDINLPSISVCVKDLNFAVRSCFMADYCYWCYKEITRAVTPKSYFVWIVIFRLLIRQCYQSYPTKSKQNVHVYSNVKASRRQNM